MHGLLLLYGVLGLLLLSVVRLLYASLASPLRSISGPLATRFTRLWYLNRVRYGHFETENISLHRKYGKLVRISPDCYSIDDPAAIKHIYGISSKFRKGDWYYGWQHPDPNRFTLFADTNIKRHAENRKRFQAMYSMSSLVNYEPFVDRCGQIFEDRMREFAAGKDGSVTNMGHWFQCYAFDVIACITYGDRFGFLDRGEDIDGAIGQLWRVMLYSTLIGIYSNLHAILFPWTSKLPWTGASGRVYVINFVQKQLDMRKMERKKRDAEKGHASAKQRDENDGLPQDFLEKMMNAHEEDPEKVTAYHVFMMGQSNIIAGSDTTAISLSAILYYLLKYPQAMQKLKAEIKDAETKGACSNPVITFKESLAMPYLQAVMKEALRMHPATGLPLWRVVPEGGAQISGYSFPAGTTIGINTWIAHRNEDVFGPDANSFRPERWLEASPDQLRRMDAYYMPFGLGSRTCIGRHISELEMSKLIPRLVRDFEFELEKPAKHWETENFWFVKPIDFNVRIRMAEK